MRCIVCGDPAEETLCELCGAELAAEPYEEDDALFDSRQPLDYDEEDFDEDPDL